MSSACYLLNVITGWKNLCIKKSSIIPDRPYLSISWKIKCSCGRAKGKLFFPPFFSLLLFWRNSCRANTVDQKIYLPTWGFWNATALSTFNCGWRSATSHGLNSGAVVTFRRYSITVSLDKKVTKALNTSSRYFF